MNEKIDLLQDILVEVMSLESSTDRLFDLIVEVKDTHLDLFYGDLSRAIAALKSKAVHLQEMAKPTSGTNAVVSTANAQPINESKEKT